MINENKTFKLFGYTSNTLKQYSHKMIVAVCNFCGNEREITMRMHTKTNGRCRTCYIQQIDCSGKDTSFYGKHHSEETKLKMSKSKQGIYNGNKNPMYGKHHSEKTKHKQSKALLGEKVHCGKVVEKYQGLKLKLNENNLDLFHTIFHIKIFTDII